MTTEHTQLPWTLRRVDLFEGGGGGGWEVVTADDVIVCDNQTYYPQAVTLAHAEYIVKACNSYPKMLEALRELVAEHDTKAEETVAVPGYILPDTGGIDLARAVLDTIDK